MDRVHRPGSHGPSASLNRHRRTSDEGPRLNPAKGVSNLGRWSRHVRLRRSRRGGGAGGGGTHGHNGGSPEHGVARTTRHHFQCGLALWDRCDTTNSPRVVLGDGVTGGRQATAASLLQGSVTVKSSCRCLSSTDNHLNSFPSLPSRSLWLQLLRMVANSSKRESADQKSGKIGRYL
jgi:hypothetical protein